MLGWTELLIIFGILILIFGASRLPKVAKSLGESFGAFKEGLEENNPELSESGNNAPDESKNRPEKKAGEDSNDGGEE